MKLLVFFCLSTFAFSSFADEECKVGYFCELISGESVLRLTEEIQDESLKMCSTTTIYNFGSGVEAAENCQAVADLGNIQH